LATINANPNLSRVSPINRNFRSLAPEIIDPDVNNVIVESKQADVFAFGMFAIELFTGRRPFEESRCLKVIRLILNGHRPGLPGNAEGVELTPPVWELLQSCWDQDPAQRPTMDDVVRLCEALLGNNQYVERMSNDQSHNELVPDARVA
jgi:serine/threonine protein kinase